MNEIRPITNAMKFMKAINESVKQHILEMKTYINKSARFKGSLNPKYNAWKVKESNKGNLEIYTKA